MASLARQRAQGAISARPKRRGLQRPCLESGRAWATGVRAVERAAVKKLGRANGRCKVLRELLAHMRDSAAPLDLRAVSTIAGQLGLGQRITRRHLAALEAEGVVLRVFMAGLRFQGQRGWATSAYVVPELLPFVRDLPPARKAAAKLALRNPLVATALVDAGHREALEAALGARLSLAAEEGRPQVKTAETQGSSALDNRYTCTEMGEAHPSVERIRSSPSQRSLSTPPNPPRAAGLVETAQEPAVAAEEAGGAVAPSPQDPSSPSGLAGRFPKPFAGGSVRPGIDEGVDGNPAAIRIDLRTLTEPRAIVAELERRGMSREEAVQREYNFRRVAAWRGWQRWCRANGDVVEGRGRQVRLRTVQHELEQLRREKRRAGAPLDPENGSDDPTGGLLT